jgi:hypothetical protein
VVGYFPAERVPHCHCPANCFSVPLQAAGYFGPAADPGERFPFNPFHGGSHHVPIGARQAEREGQCCQESWYSSPADPWCWGALPGPRHAEGQVLG